METEKVFRIYFLFANTIVLDLYFIKWDKMQVQKKNWIPPMLVGAALNLKSSIGTMSSLFRMATLKRLGIWIPFYRQLMFLQLQMVCHTFCIIYKMIVLSARK